MVDVTNFSPTHSWIKLVWYAVLNRLYVAYNSVIQEAKCLLILSVPRRKAFVPKHIKTVKRSRIFRDVSYLEEVGQYDNS